MFVNLTLSIYIAGCSSSNSEDSSDESQIETKEESSDKSEAESAAVFNTAREEQENKMYSPDSDSTYLYWLNNELLTLKGSTKCNIFALNVLYRSGYKTPDGNALSNDLFDTLKFNDILPVLSVSDLSKAEPADLIVWRNHVMIFESQLKLYDDLYAVGWWAGTQYEDNNENIRNNVCHGKYKIDGEFIVRRPVKK